jgi:hypothetical protein
MKKNIVVFIALLIVGLTTQEEKRINVPVTNDVLNNFKTGFVDGCMQDGSVTYLECSCSYDELVKEYGVDGLLDISSDYLKNGEYPEKAINTILKCFKR